MRSNLSKRTVLILLAIVTVLIAAYFLLREKGKEENVFRTTGIVEALEVEVESKIAGRIVFIGFREGDTVAAGELVAVLDQAEPDAVVKEARASLETARKSLAAGFAALDNAAARYRASLSDADRAGAELGRAGAELDLAEKDLKRAEELFEKGVIPSSELDRAVTARDTAAAGVSAANAALDASRGSATAAEASVNEAERNIDTLGAKVSEAESALGLAEVRLEDTKMYSPIDGMVDYRFLEEGETVAPGTPILTLVDTNDVWVRIGVDERFVGRIKQGQAADITLDYMPGKVFRGTVYDIGREGGFATERDVTRGRQDIRTFRTRIRVDDQEGILKPGMTVIATLPVE